MMMTGRCWVVQETFSSSHVTTIKDENLFNRKGKCYCEEKSANIFHIAFVNPKADGEMT